MKDKIWDYCLILIENMEKYEEFHDIICLDVLENLLYKIKINYQ